MIQISNRLHNKDNTSLESFLNEIMNDSVEKKAIVLKKLGEEVKQAVIKNLRRSSRKKRNGIERVHMVDDVRVKMIEDTMYGGKMAVVGGGKKTGTLWHLLNDGTFKMAATHFIDRALVEVDSNIDSIIDEMIIS